jgi:hypothetical protein
VLGALRRLQELQVRTNDRGCGSIKGRLSQPGARVWRYL